MQRCFGYLLTPVLLHHFFLLYPLGGGGGGSTHTFSPIYLPIPVPDLVFNHSLFQIQHRLDYWTECWLIRIDLEVGVSITLTAGRQYSVLHRNQSKALLINDIGRNTKQKRTQQKISKNANVKFFSKQLH